MKEIAKFLEINDSLIAKYSKASYSGEYAYHLGDDKEVERFFKRLLKVLNLDSFVEVSLKRGK